MTEKRFKVHSMIQGMEIGETIDLELCEELIKKYGSSSDIDLFIEDNGNNMTYQGVVDLLNKFYEENKELKLQLEAFKDKLYELGVSDAKQYDKRFHIVVSNDNTVRLIDHERSNDLISIGFKKHSDAADCSDALQYLCNLMNGLVEENEQLRKENDMFSCELSVSANKEISRNCRIAELEEENEQLKSTITQLIEQNHKNNDLLLSDIRILEKALWCNGCANNYGRLKELRKEFMR